MRGSSDGRWRLLDTGPRAAAENIAIDAALLESRAAGTTVNTVRFLGFTPAAALIGCHQSPWQELRLDYCESNGVDIGRRITGGGAVFFDTAQIGWEVIAGCSDIDCGPTMAHLTRAICEAAVAGLRLLGLPASFRPRNDIEVEGRKISGCGGAWEDDAFLFQGTLLVDCDFTAMLRALRVPTEKLSRHDIETASERVTSVAACLPQTPSHADIKAALVEGFEQALEIDLAPAGLFRQEEELYASKLELYDSREWLYGSEEPEEDHRMITTAHFAAGGTIRTTASFDVERDRVKSVLFSGDFFVNPRRTVNDLESHLRYCSCDDIDAAVIDFFRQRKPDGLGLKAADFIAGLKAARHKLSFTTAGLSLDEVEALTLVGPDPDKGLTGALREVEAILLPYCAKLPDCDFRNGQGCDQCGDCSVGDAYAVAQSHGITPVTILNFEHLEQVFDELLLSGVGSYIGCCCQAFAYKRHEVFRHAGMTGILIDIDDDTCYDLSLEEEAYVGLYAGSTTLKTGILNALMEYVPPLNTNAHREAELQQVDQIETVTYECPQKK